MGPVHTGQVSSVREQRTMSGTTGNAGIQGMMPTKRLKQPEEGCVIGAETGQHSRVKKLNA